MKTNYDFKSISINFINKLLNIANLSIKGESKLFIELKKIEGIPLNQKIHYLKNIEKKYPNSPLPKLKISLVLFQELNLNWLKKSSQYLKSRKNWLRKNKISKLNREIIGEEFVCGSLGNYWDIKTLIDLNNFIGLKNNFLVLKYSNFKLTNSTYFKYFKKFVKILNMQSVKKDIRDRYEVMKLPLGFFLEFQKKPFFREYVPSIIKKKKIKYFKLNKEDKTKGLSFLRKIGLKKNDWFVTLHIREERTKSKSEEFRNSSISNYIDAINLITKNGGFVFRMGDNKTTKFPKIKNFYDYAHSKYKSEHLDVFLAAKSKFCIGTPSGFYAVATSFGVPVLLTNVAQFSTFYSLHQRDLFLPRLIINKKNNQFIKLKKLFSHPYVWLSSDDQFKKKNLLSVENTKEDIKMGVEEMIKNLSKKKISKQQKLANKIAGGCTRKIFGKNISPASQISNHFLEINENRLF